MPRFFSPEGNPEVWDEKPEGYFAEDEFQEPGPQPISLTEKEVVALLRQRRDALLRESDAWMLPDHPLALGSGPAILAYRQALRDLPLQAGFPDVVEWPIEPGEPDLSASLSEPG